MDRSNVLTLVKCVKMQNKNGEFVADEITREVYCNVRSVNVNEWNAGGQNGYNPQYVFTMFEPDYEGEEICIFNGRRYSFYRTYHGRNDMIDLYAELKAGTK